MMRMFVVFVALIGLGLADVSTMELDFTLDGRARMYSETVRDGDDYQVITIPRQGVADHTVILHDYDMRVTAFKDLTTRKCYVIPMNTAICSMRGIIFKDLAEGEAVPSRRNIMITPSDDEMLDIEDEAGEKVAELCRDLPAFWARVVAGGRASRRVRRWGASASGSVSSGRGGASASGSAAAGSNSASSQSKGGNTSSSSKAN